MEESVEAFWAKFEEETGEKTLARTMGQLFASPKDPGTWGLLVLSPMGLRFRPTPGQNWFASIFKATPAPVSQAQEDDLFVPFASMIEVSFPSRKFLDALFGSPFLAVRIRYGEASGEKELRLGVDPKSDFVSRLQELRS